MEIIAIIILFFIVVQLQSFIFYKFVLSRLEYRCSFSVTEAYEGDELFLVETVCNRKILPVPWLKVDIHSSRWLDFANSHSVVAQDNRRVTSSFFLRSFQKTTRRWKLKCLKRGVFTTENVTLVSGDILGLFISSIPVTVNASLVVYPEIIDLDSVIMPIDITQGDTVVNRWIVDDPFIVSGAREYTPRDPMNRIHWKATARQNKLMVRKNDFTSRLNMTVILNIQSIEFEYDRVVDRDMIEMGIKVAATLIDRALRMGIPVRLGTNGCTIDDRQNMIFTGQAAGREHTTGLLKLLAKLELKNLKDFDDYLAGISGEITNNDVIIITSYVNNQIYEIVSEMSQRGNVVKLIILNKLVDLRNLPRGIDAYILSGADRVNGN